MGPYRHRTVEVYLSRHRQDFDKMVFVAGPRQVGKTALLESLGPLLDFRNCLSLNWDRADDTKKIRDPHYTVFKELLANAPDRPYVVLDEIHKFPKWKSFLKGYYDTFRDRIATAVTGSARLDLYRRGGDSLLGRYWLFRLHPFTMSEALGSHEQKPFNSLSQEGRPGAKEVFENLFRWGGFPEPFLKGSDATHRRWVRMRRERLIREDLRDLSRIQDLGHIDNLMNVLAQGVGSPFSLNATREFLDVSYNAARSWLKWLESLYYCFRISSYTKNVVRSLKKEGKYFLYDWSEVAEPGARFENMIAVHLKKSVDFWNDTGEGEFDLFTLRDRQKREVDFVLTREQKPWMLVEAKLRSEEIPAQLVFMAKALQTAHNILVTKGTGPGRYRVVDNQKFQVVGATDFLQLLV